MNNEDLANVGRNFEIVHAETEKITSSLSLADMTNHKGDITDSVNAVRGVIIHYDRLVKEAQVSKKLWELKKQVLDGDYEKTKDAYWMVKNEEDRTYMPS